jgi:hypothetical protein
MKTKVSNKKFQCNADNAYEKTGFVDWALKIAIKACFTVSAAIKYL